MNDKFNHKFVTQAELEDALQGRYQKRLGKQVVIPWWFCTYKFWLVVELADALKDIRIDAENLQQPTERVVIERTSETDPVVSHIS